MPKMKTKSSAKKRFKLTTKKSKKRKLALTHSTLVHPADENNIKVMMRLK